MTNYHNQREEYGKTLLELAKKDCNIVALDADLSKSTMTCLLEKESPDQFYEVGIAEQNMMSIAAGLSLVGKIPFVNSFAIFLTCRAFDQIRQAICNAKLNVKIIGSSAGLSDFGDGSSHQTVEDISIMRSLPNMTVIVPCDGIQTRKVIQEIAKYKGPVYVRLSRNNLPDITLIDDDFTIGKMYPLKDGKDITIFATGSMVSKAMEASDELTKEGISARVVNVSTIKPFDRQECINLSKDTKAALTVEEHSIIGGLGSAVAEALRNEKGIVLEFLGINDCFGQSSNSYDELLDYYHLNKEGIVDTAKKVLEIKKQ